MTPFEFGRLIKSAVGPAQPSAFPPAAPGLNPAGRNITTDQQARMWQNYGNPMGSTSYTSAPTPPKPAPAPQAPNPEHQQILSNLGKQYPRFGKGDLQDMLSLHLQGNGAGLAKFTRNTQQHYQNPDMAK
jgi:hypothetical protein